LALLVALGRVRGSKREIRFLVTAGEKDSAERNSKNQGFRHRTTKRNIRGFDEKGGTINTVEGDLFFKGNV